MSAVSDQKCNPCQNGWISSQSSCYAINNPDRPNRKTWEKAREDCRGKTAELVVVSDESEKVMREAPYIIHIFSNNWKNPKEIEPDEYLV